MKFEHFSQTSDADNQEGLIRKFEVDGPEKEHVPPEPEEVHSVEQLSYNPFDPETELQKIREVPNKEELSPEEVRAVRRENLERFKTALEQQKHGIGEIITQMREAVFANPDVAGKNLMKLVREQAAEYRLTYQQIEQFSTGIEKYSDYQEKLQGYKKQYQTGELMYGQSFGIKPFGDISLEQQGLLLVLTCENIEDYYDARSYPVHKGNPDKIPDKLYGGKSDVYVSRPEITNRLDIPLVLVNQKGVEQRIAGGEDAEAFTELIVQHEGQHFFNTFFVPAETQVTWMETLSHFSGKEATPELREDVIKSMARVIRKRQWKLDSLARDEILANYMGAAPAFIRSIKDLVSPLTSDPRYDLVALNQEDYAALPDQIARYINWYGKFVFYRPEDDEIGADPVKTEPINVTSDEVKSHLDSVFKEEYANDLEQWTDAILELEEKGYSKTEVGGLLYQAPINKWPALARRAMLKRSPKE